MASSNDSSLIGFAVTAHHRGQCVVSLASLFDWGMPMPVLKQDRSEMWGAFSVVFHPRSVSLYL